MSRMAIDGALLLLDFLPTMTALIEELYDNSALGANVLVSQVCRCR